MGNVVEDNCEDFDPWNKIMFFINLALFISNLADYIWELQTNLLKTFNDDVLVW